jgi:hypothetical protein
MKIFPESPAGVTPVEMGAEDAALMLGNDGSVQLLLPTNCRDKLVTDETEEFRATFDAFLCAAFLCDHPLADFCRKMLTPLANRALEKRHLLETMPLSPSSEMPNEIEALEPKFH